MPRARDQWDSRINKVNRQLERFQKAGEKSEVVATAENMLLNWYLDNNYQAGKMKGAKFPTSKRLTDEQKSELMEIMDFMESHKSGNYTQFKKQKEKNVDKATLHSYEQYNKNHPGEELSFEEWSEMLDTFDDIRKNYPELYEMLGSDQIRRADVARKGKGLSDKDLINMLKKIKRSSKRWNWTGESGREKARNMLERQINSYQKRSYVPKKKFSDL